MNMLNDIQQSIANSVVTFFDGKSPTGEAIVEKTNQFVAVYGYEGYVDIIVRHIESVLSCSMSIGDVITDSTSEHNKNWPERILFEDKIYSNGYEQF